MKTLRAIDLGLITRTVVVTDHVATGRIFRQARQQQKFSLRKIAKQLGCSAAYLSDLELGRRNWNELTADKIALILFP